MKPGTSEFWNLALTITSLVIALGGIASGFWIARRSRREKELYYQVFPARLFVGTTVRRTTPSFIKIIYERPGAEPEVVPEVFLSDIAFVNLGRLPIVRADQVASDLLRIEIEGARVLDIAVAAVKRSVTGIQVVQPRTEDSHTISYIDFDFLDYRDGARIQVLTTEPTVALRLRGSIIGMPEGIKAVTTAGTETTRWRKWLGRYWFLVSNVVPMAIAIAGISTIPHFAEFWKFMVWFAGIMVAAMGANILLEFLSPARHRKLPVDFPPVS